MMQPPAGGAAPGGFSQLAAQGPSAQGPSMPPQIPPQLLQMLLAQGWKPPQGSPAGAPPMPPQGGPMGMPPQGGQPPMPPGMPPQAPGQGAPQGGPPPSPQGPPPQGGIPPQILQMLMAQIQKQAPQQLAQQGRNGDNMVAHLTPGEMMVPPQVQSPKVLATLKKAFESQHVSPQQFTAGNPASSVNPKSGMPEYNFMSAFLPAALGVAGSIAAPYLAPELMSATMASAIGGGLGTAAGGMAAGQSPSQAALSGLGAGAGGYALGSLGGAGGSAAGASGGSAGSGAAMAGSNIPGSAASIMSGPMSSGTVAQTYPGISGAFQNAITNPNPLAMAGSAIGGSIGGSLAAPTKSNAPAYPDGFNSPMPQVGSLGSAQQQLGMTNSQQPRPSFTGFNPATNNPGAFNFYPGQQ